MDHWKEALPNKILSVQYEDLVGDLETTVRRILDYCDLPFEQNCVQFYKKNHLIDKKIIFKRGKKYNLPDGKILIACYHPSPRNVNTKIVNLKMIKNLFIKATKIT